jgi:hypothetical protein
MAIVHIQMNFADYIISIKSESKACPLSLHYIKTPQLIA